MAANRLQMADGRLQMAPSRGEAPHDSLSAIDHQRSAIRCRLTVTGVVQGVGFRPFVYGLATRPGLGGWVRNTSSGVTIEVEGAPEEVNEVQVALRRPALHHHPGHSLRPPADHDGAVRNVP